MLIRVKIDTYSTTYKISYGVFGTFVTLNPLFDQAGQVVAFTVTKVDHGQIQYLGYALYGAVIQHML